MAFVIKTAKTIRNNWKKSTFAAVAVSYAYGYCKEYFQTQELMRIYCEKAAKYGEQSIPLDTEPRNVTIILNPNANKRKAADEYVKYCAPILHLAGIAVNVIKTESEGHAKSLIDDLKYTDAIVVAGGDGTLSEVITGLLRRTQERPDSLPIGILPLGKTNSVANMLFSSGGNLERIRSLADAAMAVVEEVIKPIDVLKVEVIEGDNKPIYAVSGIKWGAYRDAETQKESYWVYGKLRKYATYLFNGYKNSLTWNCDAAIAYSPPCSGCSNCAKSDTQEKGWFQRFAKSQKPTFNHIVNPECQTTKHKDISTVDFTLTVPHFKINNDETAKLQVTIGPKYVDYFNFVKEGWRSEHGKKRKVAETIEARSVEIQPKNFEDKEAFFSIDNENYELKPVKITILPKLINVFCGKNNFN